MKTIIKQLFSWLGLSILLMVLWILGIFIGNMIFPSSLMDQSSEGGSNNELLFLIVCALNTLIILALIKLTRYKGWKLAGSLFLVTFGIQSFMSQIETMWFNNSLKIPANGIWAIISGGAFMSLLFAIIITWITGNFKSSDETNNGSYDNNFAPLLIKTLILSVVVWPLIYFLAGYFIAWQFTDVRLFYSGSTDKASFFAMMEGNFSSGLYYFQILRGVLWILIGLLVLSMTNGTLLQKGVILGLLIAILGGSGLLLPNPVMPYMVRMGHIAETFPSNFIWGFIMAWVFYDFTKREKEQSDAII